MVIIVRFLEFVCFPYISIIHLPRFPDAKKKPIETFDLLENANSSLGIRNLIPSNKALCNIFMRFLQFFRGRFLETFACIYNIRQCHSVSRLYLLLLILIIDCH